MLKAGALYFSIVIALIIAVVTSSLIMLAAHYRNNYLKQMRFDRLLNNLNSGITYMLAQDNWREDQRYIDLFGEGTDTLIVEKKLWGVYEVVSVQSFEAQDTLRKVWMMGKIPDSLVLYLSDEDRPLSLSGSTKISGNALLPKAGLKKVYADGKPYIHKELLYQGSSKFSDRSLPKLDTAIIHHLRSYLNSTGYSISLMDGESLHISFFEPVKVLKLPKVVKLKETSLRGNIVLISDSVVRISSSAELDGIQIFAPTIKVEEGFKGNCQLFARDSLVVADHVTFNYPSAIGIVARKGANSAPKVMLGNHVSLTGIIFTYEEIRSPLQTMVSLGKESIINGEIYSSGIIKVERGTKVNGKLSCNKFLMQTSTTLYENFLIDVTLNRWARNKYYLSAKLFGSHGENRIMKWLN